MPIKRSFILTLFVTSFGVLFYFAAVHHLSDGFSLKKISGESFEHFETFEPKDNLDWIFSQNFFYLGKGSQCYVFQSEDEQYVLKFFRLNRYRLPQFLLALPLPPFLDHIQKQRLANKTQNLAHLFQSCAIAYNELSEECGLIYLHLKKTTDLKKSVTLHDKLGRKLTLDLDDYSFLIQKKGEMILPFLTKLLATGNKEEAKKALKNLVKLIQFRSQKGISDSDAVIHKNLGFCMGKAMFFDIGQFKKEIYAKSLSESELSALTEELQFWLNQNDDELANELKMIVNSNNL